MPASLTTIVTVMAPALTTGLITTLLLAHAASADWVTGNNNNNQQANSWQQQQQQQQANSWQQQVATSARPWEMPSQQWQLPTRPQQAPVASPVASPPAVSPPPVLMDPATLLSHATPGAMGCAVKIDPERVQQMSNPNAGAGQVTESFIVHIEVPRWQENQPVTAYFGPGSARSVLNCWNVAPNTAQIASDHLMFLLGPGGENSGQASEVGCQLEGRYTGFSATTYRGIDCVAPPPPPPAYFTAVYLPAISNLRLPTYICLRC